jgi:hypothetical protein
VSDCRSIIVSLVRIGVRASVLAILLIATAWAVAPAASADGFGGPCGYVEPWAILPLPVHFNATTGSPFTPQKAEFTDTEPLPPSNFSATANWGDGQTTVAAIGPEDCHEVTAPSHVYTHSGAYRFSYTVHDAHTGLDHEIGGETVYIWGVPQRVDAPSSHVVDATVGVPWTGVVGEFTEEPLPFDGAPYYAHIEWEEGDRTWAPGVVTSAADGRLVVTATHTFTAKTSGNATVHVGIAEAEAAWPLSVTVHAQRAAAATPAPLYRFRGRPILAAVRSGRRSVAYEMIFRLNLPLPTAKSGMVQASLSGGTAVAGSILSYGRHEARDCYVAKLSGVKPTRTMSRRGLPFDLKIQTVGTIQDTAVLRRLASARRTRSFARSRLGCG